MRRFLSYSIWNIIILAIIFGGTISSAPHHQYLQNLLPFVVGVLFVLTLLVFIIIVLYRVALSSKEIWKLEELNKIKLTKTPKIYIKVNTVLDILVSLYLASFGYYLLATFYFVHFLLGTFITLLKNECLNKVEQLKEELNKENNEQ